MEHLEKYKKTKRRVITRRGVLWLGQTCNLRCHFCYFLDRIGKTDHPEHAFMSLEKAKKICSTLVDVYNNNSIDIQGGEPTIFKDIYALVEHCRKIELLPTLITNAIVLAEEGQCKSIKDAGVRDLLISFHALGKNFDRITGMEGASLKQMKALENLKRINIPFRFNCVLSKVSLTDLADIAKLAVEMNAMVVNFIVFNPFEDQQKKGKRSSVNVPKYSEVVPYLTEALDILTEAGVECNVRYLPICAVKERHRQNIYNFQQLPYDIHEWDFASWSWTGMTPQRSRAGDTSSPISLEEVTLKTASYPSALKHIAKGVKQLVLKYPRLKEPIKRFSKKVFNMGTASKKIPGSTEKDTLYWENGKMRAKLHCGYIYSDVCGRCSVKEICDGFHGDYVSIFGTDEASPLIHEEKISDPRHFIYNQEKIVEAEDYGWAL